MISVNVSFIGNDVKSLTVSGHANYDKYGKDIVCAGVSAVVTGGINALENQVENIEIINKENMLGVNVINSNKYISMGLTTILIKL